MPGCFGHQEPSRVSSMSLWDTPQLAPIPQCWNVVIKVKYGDTIKRFNGRVNGSQFDHDLALLRSKIANAYKFSLDDELIVTYFDEDWDVVMLDDDDDLHDAVLNQRLNPLKIEVKLRRAPQAKQRSSNSRSSMSTTLEDQLAQVKSAIDEALKFVTDQVHVVLAKLSNDLRCKAVESTSSLAELLDRIAKLMAPMSSMQPFNDPSNGSSVSVLKSIHESELAKDSTLQPVDMQNQKSSEALGLKSVPVEETKAQVGKTRPFSPLVPPSLGGELFDLKTRIDSHSDGIYHGHCFNFMGNETTDSITDKPLSLKNRIADFKKFRRVQFSSIFFKDVTIPNGTTIPPSTPFTKIWRVRNTGSTVWPFGTQLTWISGDQFACENSVKLLISENGFDVGQEMNVSVDCVTPAKPDIYKSYWRLASPTLQNFSQRVCILIEVVEMDFSLPQEDNNSTWKITDVASQYSSDVDEISNQYPTAVMCTNASISSEDIKAMGSDPSQSDMSCEPANEPIQAPITSSSLPAPNATPLTEFLSVPTAPAPVSAPVAAPAPVSMLVSVHAPSPVGVPTVPSPDEIIRAVEEKLLMELERMGFTQLDLNKEVLKQNEYDLQKSMDDLWALHEWDPLHNDLHELGLDEKEARAVVSCDEDIISKPEAMDLFSREDYY